jgi:tetratricopeptide (TPR) repeat protein
MTAYERLAFVLASVEKVSDQDSAFLQYGQTLFPDEGVLVYGQAQLARKRGDKNVALELLDKAIAHPGRMGQDEIKYARETKTHWIIEDIMTDVVALANAGKFQEALDLIDKLMTPDFPATTRGSLVSMRDRLAGEAKFQAAVQARREERNDDARLLFQAVIDMPKAPLNLRKQAESALGQLAGVQKKSDADQASDK